MLYPRSAGYRGLLRHWKAAGFWREQFGGRSFHRSMFGTVTRGRGDPAIGGRPPTTWRWPLHCDVNGSATRRNCGGSRKRHAGANWKPNGCASSRG